MPRDTDQSSDGVPDEWEAYQPTRRSPWKQLLLELPFAVSIIGCPIAFYLNDDHGAVVGFAVMYGAWAIWDSYAP